MSSNAITISDPRVRVKSRHGLRMLIMVDIGTKRTIKLEFEHIV
jgi:hypothetical protein